MPDSKDSNASWWLKLGIAIWPFKWSHASFLVRSPLVRIAATVPMAGYIILFGDAFDGAFGKLFDFTGALGSSHLLFSSEWKLRMVYYGGLIIGASLLIYILRCPSLSKRNHSDTEAIDEFNRTGIINDLLVEPHASREHKLDLVFARQFEPAAIRLIIAMSMNCEIETREKVLRVNQPGPILAGIDPQAMRQPDALRLHLNNVTTQAREGNSDGVNETQESFISFYNSAVQIMYHESAESTAVRDAARNVAAHKFGRAEHLNPLSRFLVWSLSMAGVSLAAMPALDVLLQVGLGDLGLLPMFEQYLIDIGWRAEEIDAAQCVPAPQLPICEGAEE